MFEAGASPFYGSSTAVPKLGIGTEYDCTRNRNCDMSGHDFERDPNSLPSVAFCRKCGGTINIETGEFMPMIHPPLFKEKEQS